MDVSAAVVHTEPDVNIPQRMQEIVDQAVGSHPAVFISGGIDSSIVLWHICRAAEPKVFTLDFGIEPQESARAQMAASTLGVPLTVIRLERFEELLADAQLYFDIPRFNAWPLALFRAAAAQGCTQAWIGEGSNEIFGYADRDFLTGWAGQIAWVRPVYDQLALALGIELRAPFTEFAAGLTHPLAVYLPPCKKILRDAYSGLLPPVLLDVPSIAPRMVNYPAFCRVHLGIEVSSAMQAKRHLTAMAARAWLDQHG